MKVNIHLTIEGTIEIEEEGLSLTEKYGKKLKRRRLSKGLTMGQLSQMSGVSTSHIGRMEREERSPSLVIATKLERALGL